jgi:transposase
LHRQITELGHDCIVVAPSLIPRKASDRIKTNRRDAMSLARLLRAGELTAVWVPDPAHEVMRGLVRARTAAVETVRVHKQQVSAFLLRHHRIFPRKKNWGARYRCWLEQQSFEHAADQIVLQEYVEGVRLAEERLGRLERTIEEFVPSWKLAPIIEALQALRGVDLVVAVTFVLEIGGIRRFESARQLMGYLGLVPEERSTGETIRRGSITKMGNARLRQLLVESAWTYRFPPRVGAKKLQKLERASPKVRQIAWKAQVRLSARYRAFAARGKKLTVACTAIARGLAGFMWAVAREVTPA